MCEKCLEAVRRYFPKVREVDAAELLVSATSYPFGEHREIARQLRNLSRRKHCDGTLATACAIADTDMDRAMRKMRPNNQIQRRR